MGSDSAKVREALCRTRFWTMRLDSGLLSQLLILLSLSVTSNSSTPEKPFGGSPRSIKVVVGCESTVRDIIKAATKDLLIGLGE